MYARISQHACICRVLSQFLLARKQATATCAAHQVNALAVTGRHSCKHMPATAVQACIHTCDVNATENSRMTPDTTDSVSCTQKPIQPYLLIACVAFDSEERAASPSLPVESGPPNEDGLYEGCCGL